MKFQDIVEKNSIEVALRFHGDTRITFSKLNKLANKLARYLKSKGLKKRDIALIEGEKSIVSYTFNFMFEVGVTYCFFDNENLKLD